MYCFEQVHQRNPRTSMLFAPVLGRRVGGWICWWYSPCSWAFTGTAMKLVFIHCFPWIDINRNGSDPSPNDSDSMLLNVPRLHCTANSVENVNKVGWRPESWGPLPIIRSETLSSLVFLFICMNGWKQGRSTSCFVVEVMRWDFSNSTLKRNSIAKAPRLMLCTC